ncbi:PAS domain-containing protein [Flavobacterium sp. GCM10027622]|uniref:PAS domain-containing protein n=1 Tax=unclassified Flavobacterium TaxID=196869 RepID=UPI003620B68A
MKSKQLSEVLLKAIDEMEDYAFFFLDINGNIQSWNPGAQKIKGYWSEEIIGKSFKCFCNQEDIDNKIPDLLLENARKNGKSLVEGWRIKKNGSSFWGSVLITAIHDENGTVIGFGKLTRDLTNQKLVDELNKEYCQKLKEMLTMTSHRVRSPLVRCLGIMNLIEDGAELKHEDMKKLVSNLKSSAIELNLFTEELTTHMSQLEKKYSL